MSKSAVNEMLAQMDRTGEQRVFVIGATNYPDTIDPAMLRAGRLEKKFFIPPPDFEARKALFQLSLSKRKKIDVGMDYDQLAKLTEHFVSADIEFIANESARIALHRKERITMNILEEVIKNSTPSVSLHELQKYAEIRARFEGSDTQGGKDRSPIGFKR
jgi:transitional endoplasmic reticulum ATPase